MLENDHEFIPAVAAEDISRPGLTAQQRREALNHLVAHVMSAGIVGLLQVIHIKQVHRQGQILLTQRIHCRLQAPSVQ